MPLAIARPDFTYLISSLANHEQLFFVLTLGVIKKHDSSSHGGKPIALADSKNSPAILSKEQMKVVLEVVC